MTKQKNNDAKKKQILKDLKNMGLVVLGVIGGELVGYGIDKVLKVDEEDGKYARLKKGVRPVVQLGVGGLGVFLLKNKDLKLILSGMAASGVKTTVKLLLKKDVLEGFLGLGEADILKAVRENVRIEPYDPDLPELEAAPVIRIESIEEDAPEFDDYEEIDQVEIL